MSSPEIFADTLVRINAEKETASQSQWAPIIGSRTEQLVARFGLHESQAMRIKTEAVRILSHCVSPYESAKINTGLVIGYVQSGKTSSFTTVAQLAEENGYRLIIVLSGVTKILAEQSSERISKTLGVESSRHWILLNSPRYSEDFDQIRQQLEKDPSRKTRPLIIMLLKHPTHIERLSKILQDCRMDELSVLVIDDEADQASLNNYVRANEQSAIYRRILELRKLLPKHTFLQYTATPQAPLLISTRDDLSPTFIEILTPGDSYTGGRTFFSSEKGLIKIIPQSDLAQIEVQDSVPPESLMIALRQFFLGVALGLVNNEDDESGNNRSLMVHPASATNSHTVFATWIKHLKETWAYYLKLGGKEPNDPDYQDLLGEFREAYVDLASTTPAIPDFEVLARRLHDAAAETQVVVMNSRTGSEPKWSQNYSFILIGGNKLN